MRDHSNQHTAMHTRKLRILQLIDILFQSCTQYVVCLKSDALFRCALTYAYVTNFSISIGVHFTVFNRKTCDMGDQGFTVRILVVMSIWVKVCEIGKHNIVNLCSLIWKIALFLCHSVPKPGLDRPDVILAAFYSTSSYVYWGYTKSSANFRNTQVNWNWSVSRLIWLACLMYPWCCSVLETYIWITWLSITTDTEPPSNIYHNHTTGWGMLFPRTKMRNQGNPF